jgi:DNA-directed RNA polymerase specialized sigma24 family protein
MSHIVIQDPTDLSARFSNRDKLGFDEDFDTLEIEEIIERELASSSDDLNGGQKFNFDDIEGFLYRIPAREADLITLYYKDKMKQEQIAKLFSITQAAVSYRLHRGIKRIRFLRTIPEINKEDFELDLGPHFTSQDLEILWRMYETTCQSEIAKQMGLTQGRVRHRFFRSLAKIKELVVEDGREKKISLKLEQKQSKREIDPDTLMREIEEAVIRSRFAKYFSVFFKISDKHFNILHEVSLPQFQDRGDAQILPME